MRNTVLEMRSVTKQFPGVKALDNVNLQVRAGEIHTICGENGAGKSTLMKVLSGAYPHTSYSGEIYVDGERCNFMTPHDSESKGIAMIYQEINMHLNISIAENLFMNEWRGKNGFVNWHQMYSEAKKCLDNIELDLDPHTQMNHLSASEQQLVSIARAVYKNPKILILDEPTSPLTEVESIRLFNIIRKLRDRGVACILITHKMHEVFTYSDRVDVLRDGKSIASHLCSETNEDEIVSEMVGRKIESYYPKRHNEPGEIALEVKNAYVESLYIANHYRVKDVSFNVRKGEIVGIAGLVGAGRSELLNAIFGKMKLASGEVYKDGKQIVVRSTHDAIKNRIALVTEERKTDGVILNMNIRENITLASMKECSKNGFFNIKKERMEAQKQFDSLNIHAPGIDFRVGNLSGGNQQKVVLAKWLMRDMDILFLDEPTRGIDVGAKTEIYKIMTKLAESGVSIVMISSELPELIAMSDRVYVLAEGELCGELKGEAITQEAIMSLISNKKKAI